MVRLLNSLYLGASTLNSYGNAKDAVELLPLEYYLGSAVPHSGTNYIDVILSGVSPLVLTNAISLNYLKLFGGTEQVPETYLDTVTLSGGCEQNGTPTPDTPLDIVCNNGILKVSPNLFNKNLVPNANEYINRSTGVTSNPSSGEFRHSDFTTIKENTQYYVGIINSAAGSAGLAFYDDTKTFISGISLNELANNNNIITSPNYTKYIRFSFRTDEGYNTNWQNTVYLVEGNQPLAEFMPYGEIYTEGTQEVVTDSLGNTASAQMLLGIGDYKDTQEVISGSVTRNIGVKALDGTELYVKDGSRYYYTAPGMLNEGNERSANLLCSHFFASVTGIEGDCFKYSGQIYFYPNMTLYPDATAFKQWLADQYANGTPVIIAYPLATATTETVIGQFLSKSPVTQTAGSIDNLPIAITESSHTTPTPTQPLQINCNNGVLKVNSITSGKNAINTSDTEQGYISSTIGQEPAIRPSSASIVIKNAIKVSNGKKYKFSYYSDTAGNRESNIVNNNGIVTSKLALSCRAGLNEYIIEADTDGYLWTTVQLGDFSVVKPTVYEIGQIYTDGTQEVVTDSLGNTANAEMLLKVGDYKDTQSVIAGSVTRNIGIKVLDGTETWAYESQYSRFNTELMPPSIIQSAIRTIPAHCTHFEMLSNGESIASITSGQGYIIRSAQSTKLYLHSDITSLENFAQYLADQYNAGTPVIVVYPLAEPTTETVTGQPLTVQQGTNIVTITQASIDNLTMEISYKATS